MKINDYNATLDEKMSEFDMWVTPSLGEIRDTPQFRVNLICTPNTGHPVLGVF